jgi:hypothetical protein
MIDAPAQGAARRHPAIAWAVVVLAMAAIWGWIGHSSKLLEMIPLASDVHGLIMFYVVLFLPLIPFALLLGLVTRTRVARAGASPAAMGLLGLVLGGGGLSLAVLFAWLNGGVTMGPPSAIMPELALLGVALILVQTSAEEFLVRGWLQPVLVEQIGPWGGVVLASVLFAALHLAGGPVAWHSLANMVLAGLLFGVLAWRSGGLIAPIAAHFAWNLAEDVGFGLAPNPGIGPFGGVRDLELAGPALWGGGGEGLNASIGTTIVLVALILPFLARRAAPQSEPAPA